MENVKQFISWCKSKFNNIRYREIGPTLYDRKNQKKIKERIPFIIWLEDEIMYSKPLDFIDRWNLIRYLLKNENIHDGHKYNKYTSASKIPSFIDFYKINMSDFELDNPNMYKTFNDFFKRHIKPEKRPISDIDNSSIIISPADCRLSVFTTLTEACKLFIKGKQFTMTSLLLNNVSISDQEKANSILSIFNENSTTANFRLAPMDYHHFHSPVTGTIISMYHIDGQYFTVKPKALKSNINVLGENTRTIICIDTHDHGCVLFIAIGAEAVGTVNCDAYENQLIKKGERLGNFEYGGSDIFVVFEKNVQWDDDLYDMSSNGTESLVLFGDRIGTFD